MLTKLVSGGQSGVDRAALDVALDLGIPCGGWCPRGRKAEDGTIPDRYPLGNAFGRLPPAHAVERARLGRHAHPFLGRADRRHLVDGEDLPQLQEAASCD
jgi:hypothetical protein